MKTVRHTSTLFCNGGPQVFEACDDGGAKFIAVMVEPDGGRECYLVAGVESKRLG